MANYRKKPVVIEAFQFEASWKPTQEFLDAVCRKECQGTRSSPHIHTLEGNHYIIVEDWIIKGVKGEFYPCKPDIFQSTYEVVS